MDNKKKFTVINDSNKKVCKNTEIYVRDHGICVNCMYVNSYTGAVICIAIDTSMVDSDDDPKVYCEKITLFKGVNLNLVTAVSSHYSDVAEITKELIDDAEYINYPTNNEGFINLNKIGKLNNVTIKIISNDPEVKDGIKKAFKDIGCDVKIKDSYRLPYPNDLDTKYPVKMCKLIMKHTHDNRVPISLPAVDDLSALVCGKILKLEG